MRKNSTAKTTAKGTTRLPTGIRLSVHPEMCHVVCIEFDSIDLMTLHMDGFSTEKEGAVPRRTGHNFEINYADIRMKRTDVTHEERTLYNQLHVVCPDVKYVVAWKRGDDLTRRHELQHAKFATNAEFREKVLRIWNTVLSNRQRGCVVAFLRRCGYPDEVMIDEFQAYYYTERRGFFGCVIDVDVDD
jgi:hypothetical protein